MTTVWIISRKSDGEILGAFAREADAVGYAVYQLANTGEAMTVTEMYLAPPGSMDPPSVRPN